MLILLALAGCSPLKTHVDWDPSRFHGYRFSMADLYVIVGASKLLCQLFTHKHRSVLTAGTANGDGDIAALIFFKYG